MKLTVIKGELPKRKKTVEEARSMIENYGFNQCLDEIETVEISQEDIEKVYYDYEGLKPEDCPEEHNDWVKGISKAIIKLGGEDV